MRVRILLLQARNPDDPVREEERCSFAAKSGLSEQQVVPYDLLHGPPALRRVTSYDALMIGGSGDYYVSKGDLPAVSAVYELLQEVVQVGHPTFASCFGFQLLVEALGGRIIHDPDNMEVGTFELSLTEPGTRDPLFGPMPARFLAQCGRKDRAERLPESVLHLASSERCPFHAFRVPRQPIWSTQFHPELDRESNRRRFLRYLEGYASHMGADEQAQALENFKESRETETLIPRFLQLVFG